MPWGTIPVANIKGPAGDDGSRGNGYFTSSKNADDPTFDPPNDVLGYPEGGLLIGDTVVGPTGRVFVLEEDQ